MNQTHHFEIEGKRFSYPQHTAHLDEFTIQSTPRPYQVKWDMAHNPLTTINKLLNEKANNLLLIDKQVLHFYGDAITISPDRIFATDATEMFKTLTGVSSVFDFLHDRSFTKSENLLVVGGGIIQDVGGFVGAAYKRGIRWTYVPTTLLSMCDSCIGSKTGINYRNVKNQIAVFSAPHQILINPNFLKTLPEEAIYSGLGEMLKYAIISGPESVNLYERHVHAGKVQNAQDYKALINHSLTVKKSIIEEDEFELSHRRSLNYGHTFGHALEVMTDYAIPHGIAVVVGMLLANELSHELGLLSATEKESLGILCQALIPQTMRQTLKSLQARDLVNLLKKDKKVLGNQINFIIAKTAGSLQFLPCQMDDELVARLDQVMQKAFAQL